MAAIKELLHVRPSVLDPAVAGSLLWVLTKGPPGIRERLAQRTSSLAYAPSIETIIKALKWILAIGVAGKLSTLLDRWAMNGWKINSGGRAWNWPSEVAVITGGSSGIGADIVKRLARAQVTVAVIDVQPLSAELQRFRNVKYYECDIRSREKVMETAAKIKTELGAPSILINNAGIGVGNLIAEQSEANLEKIFHINIISHYYTIQAFLPDMLARKKGHIVATASLASFVGTGGMADYAATKAGVMAMAESLRGELNYVYKAPYIRVTCVHPSWVRTPLTAPFMHRITATGMGVMEPGDVGKAVTAQIFNDRSGQLVVPPSLNHAAMLRGLPLWVHQLISLRSKTQLAEQFSHISKSSSR